MTTDESWRDSDTGQPVVFSQTPIQVHDPITKALQNRDGNPNSLNQQDDLFLPEVLHEFSDVDTSHLAQHHTLGPGPNQAASGDHSHSNIENVLLLNLVGATATIPDPSTKSITYLQLSNTNCTLAFPTAAAGKSFTVVVQQANPLGPGNTAYTIVWPSNVHWPGGTTPVISTGIGAQDVFSFMCVDGTNWFGFVAGQGY